MVGIILSDKWSPFQHPEVIKAPKVTHLQYQSGLRVLMLYTQLILAAANPITICRRIMY